MALEFLRKILVYKAEWLRGPGGSILSIVAMYAPKKSRVSFPPCQMAACAERKPGAWSSCQLVMPLVQMSGALLVMPAWLQVLC